MSLSVPRTALFLSQRSLCGKQSRQCPRVDWRAFLASPDFVSNIQPTVRRQNRSGIFGIGPGQPCFISQHTTLAGMDVRVTVLAWVLGARVGGGRFPPSRNAGS